MLAEMYDELWRKADEWVYDHFDGDDLQYFIRTTDYGNLVFFIEKKCKQMFGIIIMRYYYNSAKRKREQKHD